MQSMHQLLGGGGGFCRPGMHTHHGRVVRRLWRAVAECQAPQQQQLVQTAPQPQQAEEAALHGHWLHGQGPEPPLQQPQMQHKIGFPYDSIRDLMAEGDRHVEPAELVAMLASQLTEERVSKIKRVVGERTFSVLPIVEGIYDMGNLGAVCRSADAMGFGAVHCINTSDERYKQSKRTSAGAEKWLDVKMWRSAREALTAVKDAGYQVVVTHLTQSSVKIQDVDFTLPTAFVLGNEKQGVSDEAVALADKCAIIPMAGFAESFNISVAGALVMYEAQQQRVRKLGRSGDLTEEQQLILQAALMLRSTRQGPSLVKELLERPPPAWQPKRLKAQIEERRRHKQGGISRTSET